MEAMAQVNSMIYPDLASINMYELHCMAILPYSP
jgi:hypothetical protein